MSYERKELEKLYDDSVTMGRLGTGDPIKHMVNGALKIIRDQEKLAVHHYRATILAENYDSVKGSFDLDGIANMVIGEENDERDN